MRISDWSSDVCSSDLSPRPAAAERFEQVDLIVGDARVGIGERAARVGQRAFGIEQIERIDRALELLRARDRGGEIGSASCRETCVGTCRSRWSVCKSIKKIKRRETRLQKHI